MDRIGDDGEIRYDDMPPLGRPPLLTPEARAMTGAGLVLCSLLVGGLFQVLGFLLLDRLGENSQAGQYAVYALPTGLMAGAGAWLARTALPDLVLDRILRALAVAALVVGTVIAAATALGIVAAFALEPGF
jgi:hypothetical protein